MKSDIMEGVWGKSCVSFCKCPRVAQVVPLEILHCDGVGLAKGNGK